VPKEEKRQGVKWAVEGGGEGDEFKMEEGIIDVFHEEQIIGFHQ
jgi:hypothetical protein